MISAVRNTWSAYVAILVGSALSLLALREVARHVLTVDKVSLPKATLPTVAHSNSLLHLLLALFAVLVVSRLLGYVLRRLGQPEVIGDITAGIVLGPSVLGHFAADWGRFLFPTQVVPLLSALANLGVLVFMFPVGLELDQTALRRRGHAALIISHASIALPFLLGTVLALTIYRETAPAGVPFEIFALFLGAAMSVTAFPVLARILRDRGLQQTTLGALALSCAAIDDVTAWCVLALVVGIATAAPMQGLVTLLWTAQFVLCAYVLLRPLIKWIAAREERRTEVSQSGIAAGLGIMLVAAMTTELIGVHALFGAFFAGAMIPHDTRWAQALRAKLEDVVLVLLLPAFFAHTGLRTELGLLASVHDWQLCGAVVAVACLGKLGGTYFAARFTGLSRSDACALGALMNTRGLMELVVLNIGLDLGIIGPRLFAMMVLMALFTTLLAGPILQSMSKRCLLAPARFA